MITPYSGKNLCEEKKIYNYRLSRARRVSENAFGILTQRWRIFNGPIYMSPDNIEMIVKASLVLHNYLQSFSSTIIENEIVESERSQSPESAQHLENNGFSVRDKFKDYFCTSGAVDWQRDFAMRGLELV